MIVLSHSVVNRKSSHQQVKVIQKTTDFIINVFEITSTFVERFEILVVCLFCSCRIDKARRKTWVACFLETIKQR